MAFALYTHQDGVLKLSAQLYPLLPDEPRIVRLEMDFGNGFEAVVEEPVVELGWSAHFRREGWDNSSDVPYRVRHGERAMFEGLIRRDPIDKETIVVGSLSCNSSRTPGSRESIIENLKAIDPDFLFFAGDQSYHHTEHTFGWLEWGAQFREVIGNRPVVTIPDDHDVGQANIWGENGILATNPQGPSGGYFYPAEYVNLVQRCQTWHLPDPVDPAPIERGITVYFTRLNVGGIDFAIIEDRKFKSGPEGKIPQQGPRPDHITDPSYDRASIDLPNLVLLGERQMKFLNEWGQDWSNAEMKCVLSQTAFCGAVHLHGTVDNRLLADLDSNGWPQTGRNNALIEIRRAGATHLCGDQHLAVVVKHGIKDDADGPYAFTSPAIVNTIYGRWWMPDDGQSAAEPVPHSPLPWTGNYQDGFGNRIRMLAYANPGDIRDEKQRGDGFGIARFNKRDRTITFECWPRFASVQDGDQAQFPGWPMTVDAAANDGRRVFGYLPTVVATDGIQPVVQVIHEQTGETVYTTRSKSNSFQPRVYADGTYTIRVGLAKADELLAEGLKPSEPGSGKNVTLTWSPRSN
ncbi:MAG: hypothetical protein Q8M16_06480 [Pirellulaceae bacterium]|nr:hypothetical protein [Pirellulaceae bacterium]